MATLTTSKSDHMSLRVSPSTKDMLEKAASISGQSLTDFVIATSTEKARQVVEHYRIIQIGQSAFDEFAAALDDPAVLPVTPVASKLIGEYANTVREDGTLDWS